MTTVGSQDTTGGMTRDELKELACLGFSADLVMQSFCHTAAYPKPVDIKLQHTLPDFIRTRGGVSLRQMDAGRLRFPDASFDRVLAPYVISVVPEPRRVMHEIARVCRPGGTVVVVNHFLSPSTILGAAERTLTPASRWISNPWAWRSASGSAAART